MFQFWNYNNFYKTEINKCKELRRNCSVKYMILKFYLEIELVVCTDLKYFFLVQISFVLMAYPSNTQDHSVNRCHSLNEAAEGFFNLHRKHPGPCRISRVDLEGRDKSFGRSDCGKGWVDSAHADQAQCFASCRLRRNFILCLRQFGTYYSWKCSLENDYFFYIRFMEEVLSCFVSI